MADDSKQMDFETIIWELQRIEDIQQKQEEIREELSETTEEVEEVKVSTEDVEKVIGIKESDKKKNVIDGDKLSTTLTTSEKKRYENIAKEFIAGAGKELENVRKTVEFKEAMSTVKTKFTDGVVKFKEGLKKAQKTGSFFGKLMIIIGLLGSIVYLFKEKILSAFPNMGEHITNIFDAVKGVLGNLLGSVIDYVTQGIGTTFMNLLKEVVVNVIPAFIGTFFQFTLPNAIVNLYLGILSSFSGDASTMYNKRVGEMLDEDMEQLGQAAVEDMRRQAGAGTDAVKGLIDSTTEAQGRVNALGANAEYSELRQAQMGAAAVTMVGDDSILNHLNDLVVGDLKIKDLIDSGDLNASTFLAEIQRVKEGGVTNDELVAALNASVSQGIRESVDLTGTSVNGSEVSAFSDAIIRMSDTAQDRQNTIGNLFTQKREAEQRENDRLNEYRRTITEVNATNVISDELAEAFKTLVENIVRFLSGNTIADSIKGSLNELNEKFTTFFTEFNTFIAKSFSNVGNNFVALIDLFRNKFQAIENKVTNFESIANSIQTSASSVTTNYDINFNAIVNVDLMQQTNEHSISNLVNETISIDEQLVSVMKQTNDKMVQIISSFGKVRDLHTCSKEYINAQIEVTGKQLQDNIDVNKRGIVENGRKINDIENIIKTPVTKPKPLRQISPCLDVS